MNVTVDEIKSDIEGVLERIRDGETLVVTDHDRPIAEIRPVVRARTPRPFGLARGTFSVADDFDAPLPEDILRDFER